MEDNTLSKEGFTIKFAAEARAANSAVMQSADMILIHPAVARSRRGVTGKDAQPGAPQQDTYEIERTRMWQSGQLAVASAAKQPPQKRRQPGLVQLVPGNRNHRGV